MSAARITGAAASLLIHAAFLASLLTHPIQQSEQRTPVAAQPESEDAHMRLVATPDAEGDGLACEHSFRGIGILHWQSGLITDVVAGGPADRAGAQIGDYLLNDAVFSRDGYPLGHRLPLRVERDGKQLNLIVYVGRVCYERPHTVSHQ